MRGSCAYAAVDSAQIQCRGGSGYLKGKSAIEITKCFWESTENNGRNFLSQRVLYERHRNWREGNSALHKASREKRQKIDQFKLM